MYYDNKSFKHFYSNILAYIWVTLSNSSIMCMSVFKDKRISKIVQNDLGIVYLTSNAHYFNV